MQGIKQIKGKLEISLSAFSVVEVKRNQRAQSKDCPQRVRIIKQHQKQNQTCRENEEFSVFVFCCCGKNRQKNSAEAVIKIKGDKFSFPKEAKYRKKSKHKTENIILLTLFVFAVFVEAV